MDKRHERELHNAYLRGRSKGFENGKRNADDLGGRITELEFENKAQKEVIKIDVQMFEAIRNEYPNTKDLQAKILYREEQVEKALKVKNV